VTPLSDLSIRRVDKPEWELFKSFWDGYPSWQNSIDAVDRIPNERVVVCAYLDEVLVGYGVAFKPWANLMQLAVAREHRRKGFGSRILAALQAEVLESLKVTNVDEELTGTMTFFEGKGFEMVFEQLEMVKTF
jgi:GNAT superfamily N-acetyltransferase